MRRNQFAAKGNRCSMNFLMISNILIYLFGSKYKFYYTDFRSKSNNHIKIYRQEYFYGSSQKWIPKNVDKGISFLIGEILFESGYYRTSLFRRKTFWLLFGPSKSNKEKIFFIGDRNDHIQFGNDIILYKLSM
jgi:hypothetical protein